MKDSNLEDGCRDADCALCGGCYSAGPLKGARYPPCLACREAMIAHGLAAPMSSRVAVA